MTISFTDSVTGKTYWCARGGKELPYGFSVSGRRAVQVAQFFRADRIRARGRGNRQMSIDFSVDKEYDNLTDAALAAAGEESIIPDEGTLTIDETDLESNSSMSMEAAFESLDVTQRGVTLTMRYRFVGGGFDVEVVPSTEPSPN